MIVQLGTLLQVLPRAEGRDVVEGMQNALAMLVAIALVGILIVTIICMRQRQE